MDAYLIFSHKPYTITKNTFFLFIFVLAAAQDNIGLVVGLEPNFFYYGMLNVYRGNPISYPTNYDHTDQDTDRTHYFSFYQDTDITALKTDAENNRLIFIDALDHYIKVFEDFNVWFNGTNQKITPIHAGMSDTVHTRMAYDWLTGNLYWTDNRYNWIAMQNVNKGDVNSPSYKVLIHEGTVAPAGIAIDPLKR